MLKRAIFTTVLPGEEWIFSGFREIMSMPPLKSPSVPV
jgi:hypothetical protein